MKNSKKLCNAILLESIFEDIIKDEYENGNFYSIKAFNNIDIITYYKNTYLKLASLKKYSFLKQSWLYKQFDTASLQNQPDKWILLGAEETHKCINIVWWDYIHKELFKDYSIDTFKEDIENNTYVIKKLQ